MKQGQPLVSIVIPAFNHAEHLIEAIDSVLSQTYPNIELIVLDDGSTDSTPSVLERYGNRFQWESHANMGQAATLNKGWNMSRGEVLSYLSADDVLLPHATAEAVKILSANSDIVMTYCDFHLIDRTSNVFRTVRTSDYDYFKMVVNTVCIPGPGVFFRRAAWQRTGGWNVFLRQWPDFDYWLRLGLQGRFARIGVPCANFRVHDGSQTFAPIDSKRADEPIQILEQYFAAAIRVPATITAAKQRALSSAFLTSAQLHLRSGRLLTGCFRIWQATRVYWPVLLTFSAWRLILHGLCARPLTLLRIALSRRP